MIQQEWQAKTNLSGVVFSQNATPTASASLTSPNFYYQTFYLPANYERGENDQARIPALTGFQFLVDVATGYAPYASCDYVFQQNRFGQWNTLVEGTMIGAHTDGRMWFDVIFDNPLELTEDDLNTEYRWGVLGRTILGPTIGLPVDYNGLNIVTINGVDIAVNPLIPGFPTPIVYQGDPGILLFDSDSNSTTFSHQFGLTDIVYTSPNPLTNTDAEASGGGMVYIQTVTSGEAFLINFPPIEDASFNFRILADCADQGVDHLGNQYRSTVTKKQIGSVNTFDASLEDFTYWLSKPNPSKFAVESIYIDVSTDDNSPSVIDRILLDPITPGVWFNVYYSLEGVPGTVVAEWENKLWTPIPQSFHALKRGQYVLPAPITAKYICLEFSHLQGQPYDPGAYALPSIYRKFPKWVEDHYLGNVKTTADNFIAQNVTIIYDYLSFAFETYKLDLNPNPISPSSYLPAPSSTFNTSTNKVDATSLQGIVGGFKFGAPPGASVDPTSTIGSVSSSLQETQSSYPVEKLTIPIGANTITVSSIDRQSALDELNFPQMQFYLRSRHTYKLVSANYEFNRAYFAGLRELAFLRDNYNIPHDQAIYLESAGDNTNVLVNDFNLQNGVWVNA